MRFFLGASRPNWLADPRFADVPLFLSHRSLARRMRMPRAVGIWSLDSGGFTELSMFGRWQTSPSEYAAAIRRYAEEIGNLAWASPQDWMCEPKMLEKTGLSVADHQRLTIVSVQELRALGAPVIPVLQGWVPSDYWRHVEAYDRAGFDLTKEPLVGIGSVCRRQNTKEAAALVHNIAKCGIVLHTYGFKITGLGACAAVIGSSDSFAWSLNARKNPAHEDCVGKHQHCNNCVLWALRWRRSLLDSLSRRRGWQIPLFDATKRNYE